MPIQNITELFALDGRKFVTEAYRNLLNREPDIQGMAYYLGRLAQGHGKDGVIVQLAKSPECKPHDQIEGLKQLIEDRRRAQHWFWGRFTIRNRFENTLQNCLFSFDSLVEREHEFLTKQMVQVQKELSTLRYALALQTNRSETRTELNDVKHHLKQVEEQIVGLRRDVFGTQEDVYRQQTHIDEIIDSNTHHLGHGKSESRFGKSPIIPSMETLEIDTDFDAEFYIQTYPDVAASGIDPYTHYLDHGKSEGRLGKPPIIPSMEPLEIDTDFDIDQYTHYLDHGKSEGRFGEPPIIPGMEILEIDTDFDAEFYIQSYPDIADSGIDPYIHYLNHGKSEGRFGKPPIIPGMDALTHLDSHRETVLVVCHEGSRTGAPILGYNLVKELLHLYNVVALFIGSGPMLDACCVLGAAVLGPTGSQNSPIISDRIIADILKHTHLRFAIVNSIEARFPLAPLARFHVPTVSLLHEFAAYTRPCGAFPDTVRWSGVTVFSSRLTRDNALTNHGELQEIDFPIIPQGRCILPGSSAAGSSDPALSSIVRPADFPAEGLVVLGLGAVQLRKGVDLFLDCASRIVRNAPDLPIRFVWIGKGYDAKNDTQYSVYLSDQIQRAGLVERVEFLDEMPDLQGVYAAADILLLSSRLDPLPNVAIDALAEGLPVLCFDEATGIADILREHGMAEDCVAPYLDTARMAEKVLAIARSPALRQELADRAIRLSAKTFQMTKYVERIMALAEEQRLRSLQEVLDIAAIVDAGILEPSHALHPNTTSSAANSEETALLYVRSWASGVSPRKPFPGFHPGIYREQHGLARPNIDPLADYLRHGRPAGPWFLPIITPDTPTRPVFEQRIALHIHAFYPDLVVPIIDALAQNQSPINLLISVTNEEAKHCLNRLLENYRRGKVEVRCVRNRGRDLAPFCTVFADTIRRDYDIVGHVHTKHSPEIGAEAGQQWMRFLLNHILGGAAPMADQILSIMAADPSIGMVFPDDPYIMSWGKNRPYAESMAQRLGIKDPLLKSIVFPVGSMFWARVAALEPLLGLGLTWNDYPAEPVPYDGTMLHALERLLPMVATKTGYTLALSHVPGITR